MLRHPHGRCVPPIGKQKESCMADLNQLKQKYAPVIDTIQSFSAQGASVGNVALDGDKLLLQASVPSPVCANRVGGRIKQGAPPYSDRTTRSRRPARYSRTPSNPATIFR